MAARRGSVGPCDGLPRCASPSTATGSGERGPIGAEALELEQDLVRAADLPLARWANHELAELCKCLDPKRITSVPVAMEVSAEHGIELLWDSPTTAAPSPWEAADDGWAWRLLYDPDLRLPPEPEPAPIPGFVTLGERDGKLLLVNIEAFGGLAVTGAPERADQLMRSISAEFAHGEEFANSLVTVVGSEIEVAGSDRIDAGDDETTLDLINATMRQHDAVLDRAGFVNTFQLRMRGDASDRHLFVIAGLDAERCPTGVRPNRGVALLTGAPTAGLAEVRLEEDGAVLEPLGVRFTPTGLSAAELEEVNDLIEMADEDLEPIDEIYDDELFLVDEDKSDEVDSDGDRQGSSPDDPEEEPKLIVRVLGRPSVDGHPKLGRIEVNILAYLACNGHRAESDKLLDAVWGGKWISPATFANRLSKLRRALPDFIAPRDPTDRVVVLNRRVVTDVTIIERLWRAASRSPDEGGPLLVEAMSFVNGIPFDEPGYEWAHEGHHVYRAEDLVRRLVQRHAAIASTECAADAEGRMAPDGFRELPCDDATHGYR